jgi:hypothetical protein
LKFNVHRYTPKPGGEELAAPGEEYEGGEDGAEAADDEKGWDLEHAGDLPPRVPHLPRKFLQVNEPWRRRVRRERVAAEVEAAEAAARALAAAIAADLVPLIAAAEAAAEGAAKGDKDKVPKSRRCQLDHDPRNNALWLRYVRASVAKQSADHGAALVHPRDRFGKEAGAYTRSLISST